MLGFFESKLKFDAKSKGFVIREIPGATGFTVTVRRADNLGRDIGKLTIKSLDGIERTKIKGFILLPLEGNFQFDSWANDNPALAVYTGYYQAIVVPEGCHASEIKTHTFCLTEDEAKVFVAITKKNDTTDSPPTPSLQLLQQFPKPADISVSAEITVPPPEPEHVQHVLTAHEIQPATTDTVVEKIPETAAKVHSAQEEIPVTIHERAPNTPDLSLTTTKNEKPVVGLMAQPKSSNGNGENGGFPITIPSNSGRPDPNLSVQMTELESLLAATKELFDALQSKNAEYEKKINGFESRLQERWLTFLFALKRANTAAIQSELETVTALRISSRAINQETSTSQIRLEQLIESVGRKDNARQSVFSVKVEETLAEIRKRGDEQILVKLADLSEKFENALSVEDSKRNKRQKSFTRRLGKEIVSVMQLKAEYSKLVDQQQQLLSEIEQERQAAAHKQAQHESLLQQNQARVAAIKMELNDALKQSYAATSEVQKYRQDVETLKAEVTRLKPGWRKLVDWISYG